MTQGYVKTALGDTEIELYLGTTEEGAEVTIIEIYFHGNLIRSLAILDESTYELDMEE